MQVWTFDKGTPQEQNRWCVGQIITCPSSFAHQFFVEWADPQPDEPARGYTMLKHALYSIKDEAPPSSWFVFGEDATLEELRSLADAAARRVAVPDPQPVPTLTIASGPNAGEVAQLGHRVMLHQTHMRALGLEPIAQPAVIAGVDPGARLLHVWWAPTISADHAGWDMLVQAATSSSHALERWRDWVAQRRAPAAERGILQEMADKLPAGCIESWVPADSAHITLCH